MRKTQPCTRKEPTIALFNIVFLMLVFFMVAGTLSPPLAPELEVVDTSALEGAPPPDALVIHPDGQLSFRGSPPPDVASHIAGLPPETRTQIRVVPDRDVSAGILASIGRALAQAGAERVLIVTERGLQ